MRVSNAAPDLQRLKIDRSAAAPRRSSALPWVLVALLLAAGAVGWRQGWFGAGGGLPAVEVARVQRLGGAAAQSGISANGYVVARTQAALSTDVQGRLVELPVEEGDRVRQGDLIARLDTRQLEAALARNRANALAAEADLARARDEQVRLAHEEERARAALQWAEDELARATSLVASGDERGAVLQQARSARDQARSGADAAATAVRAQTAAIHGAEAAQDAAVAAMREVEVMIEKSSVRAPFDGVITRKNAEIGEVVSAIGATGPNARGAVATLVDFSTLEVQVELAQTSLGAARTGAAVLIYLDAFPEQAYRGRVRQIWPTADRVKATVELRCEFLERDERILPEMGVRVVFPPEEASAEAKPVEILLPHRALARGGESAVFLFRGEAAERRAITIAEERADGTVRVAAGLEGGELVILDPPADLLDGARVRRKETP